MLRGSRAPSPAGPAWRPVRDRQRTVYNAPEPLNGAAEDPAGAGRSSSRAGEAPGEGCQDVPGCHGCLARHRRGRDPSTPAQEHWNRHACRSAGERGRQPRRGWTGSGKKEDRPEQGRACAGCGELLRGQNPGGVPAFRSSGFRADAQEQKIRERPAAGPWSCLPARAGAVPQRAAGLPDSADPGNNQVAGSPWCVDHRPAGGWAAGGCSGHGAGAGRQ